MAAGDFTIDATSRVSLGNATQISGTIEASTSGAQADIFPNGYIINFAITGNQDDLDVAVPQVNINTSDGSTADNGSVWIDANAGAPDTFSWTATFIS
jgi:hypothetical protein